jgi:hypothetical protein
MNLDKYTKQSIVTAIIQDLPAIDKVKRADEIKAAIVKAMSPEVRKMYKTKPEALRVTSVSYADPMRTWSGETVVGDVTKKQIDEITAPYVKAEDERADMKRKLTMAFEGIRTLKAALKAFPEFKKYMPTEAEPTKNLPALANVMADLSKLGWPQGANKLTGDTK